MQISKYQEHKKSKSDIPHIESGNFFYVLMLILG